MTSPQIPAHKVDIHKECIELESFLTAVFGGRAFRNPDGVIEAFDTFHGDYPFEWMNEITDEILPEFADCTTKATFGDWLNEQLHINRAYTPENGFTPIDGSSLNLTGWSILITFGGPTVVLERCPFSRKCTYQRTDGVESWADSSGRFKPRYSIEFSSEIAEMIHDYIEEMYL